ncbi:PDR/VanB family oxidoreductase [Ottowia thiooxydans]|uniref:Ferredoxin-NADP reductase n=1 Tax=Ottowia thiooxydans TaxID=219182 RepID=A0ABV2Q4S9_9BURK
MTMAETLQVQVKSVSHEADGILLFEFRPVPPLMQLPVFSAGAHIDLQLPNGLIRSYSLISMPGGVHHYVIGVNKDPHSRGGSLYVHERMRPGDVITISHPRNNFPLEEDADHSVLVAGGIGITPLWSMIQRLETLGRSWELYYAARSRRNAAFLQELRLLSDVHPAKVHLSFSEEPGGAMLDLVKIVAVAPSAAHLYCCGPVPMIEAFEKAAAGRPPARVHTEFFAAREKPDMAGGFTVELARSGMIVSVATGKTILDALLDAGVNAPYSCQEGICGTCQVNVLGGIPDHRDLVLSEAERADNKTMLICCSGSKSDRLVIDL